MTEPSAAGRSALAMTWDELRDRLAATGHDLDEATGQPFPTPETVVTVGANLDPTLKPRWRSRYFACLLRSPDDPVPALAGDPEFAVPEAFRGAAVDRPAEDPLMEGPFRWLLPRLAGLGRLLLWSADGRDPVRNVAALNLSREDDRRTLWAAASDVSRTCEDLYVSDADCREVYLLHHHDKIVVSVPDASGRDALLAGLARRHDLFEDCSNYLAEADDAS